MSATALGTVLRGKPDRVAIEWSTVVLALALAAAVLVHPGDPIYAAAVTLAFAALTVWIVVQDLKTFTIADGAVVSIAVLGLAMRWSTGDRAFAIGLDVALTGGSLLAFREIYYRRKGVDGLGFGDVKLAAACGIFVGAQGFAWGLFAASAVGLVAALGRRALAHRGRAPVPADRIAFGAFLAPAFWAIWLWQQIAALPLDSGG